MTPRSKIVQRIEHDVEGLEPVRVKLRIHDVRMVRFKLCAWFELMRNFLGNLKTTRGCQIILLFEVGGYAHAWGRCDKGAAEDSGRRTHQGLGFLDVLVAEEELAIEVTEINGI